MRYKEWECDKTIQKVKDVGECFSLCFVGGELSDASIECRSPKAEYRATGRL